jgi:hypothetical protein
MIVIWKKTLSEQFNASLSMLESAIRKCPENLWEASMWNDPGMPAEFSSVWYTAYHALFWLDFYLSSAAADFAPPQPFTLSELDPAGVMPPRVYTGGELLAYLEHNRKKGLAIIAALTEETASRLVKFNWGEMPYLELLIDITRHNQEHGAQINMFMGQQVGLNARWVTMPD